MKTKNYSDKYQVGAGAHKKNYSGQHPSELNYRNHQKNFPERRRGSASMPNSRPTDRKLGRGTESERSSVSGSRHRNNERYRNLNYQRPKYPSNSRPSNYHKTSNRDRNLFNRNQNRQYSSNDRWSRFSEPAANHPKLPVQHDLVTSAPYSSNATAKQKSRKSPERTESLAPADEKDVFQPPLQTETRGNLAEDHFEPGTHNNKSYSHQHRSERERKNHHQLFPPVRQADSVSMPYSRPRDRKLERGTESEQSSVSGSRHRNNEGYPNSNYRRSDNHHYPSNSRDSRPSNYSKGPNYRGRNVSHPNKNHQYSSNDRRNRASDPAPHRSLLPLKEESVTVVAITYSSKATVNQNEALELPGIKESQDTLPVDNNPAEGFLCPQCHVRYKTKSYRNRHKYTAKCKQIAGLLLKATTGSDSGN